MRDVAVLADLRRRAQLALTSDLLEEWHRYTVPAFTERLRLRTRTLCEEEHKPWPGRSRHARFVSPAAERDRQAAFDADIAMLEVGTIDRPRLRIVDDQGNQIDTLTGEVLPD